MIEEKDVQRTQIEPAELAKLKSTLKDALRFLESSGANNIPVSEANYLDHTLSDGLRSFRAAILRVSISQPQRLYR